MRQSRQSLYFDDVEVGDEFMSSSRTISEADVMQFAGLTGDMNELHTSEKYAQSTSYGTRIAHGMLTLSMANGLYVRMELFPNSVFLGIDNWKFLKAVRLGDTIQVRFRIEDKRATKDGRRGIVGMKYEVCNQNDEIVAEGVLRRMVGRRPEENADGNK